MAFDVLNGIMVVPGAIGMFCKKYVLEVGLFSTDTLAEDCDLTLRLLVAGYKVKTCNEAIAYTEAPEKISSFIKQRKRWSYGIMQSFWKHRKLIFNFKKANMGWVVLPNILIFQMILPMFNPLVDIILILSLIFGKTTIVLFLYVIYMLIDMLLAKIAYAFEGEPLSFKTLLMMIPQLIIYRQLFFYILIMSYIKILKGELQHWGIMKRSGAVKSILNNSSLLDD
jgi:cellulose synthase/poly-beta-1,6-N-acetylglucosamine synthase-like glycosyltransferase